MTRRLLARAFAALVFTLLGLAGAAAHVTEIAVLRVSEVDAGRYTVAWELKPNTDIGAGLQPLFPDHCTLIDEVQLDCGARGLVGELGFEQIGSGQTAAMFKIRAADGTAQVHTLTPARPVVTVNPTYCAGGLECLLEVGRAYIAIGFEHILLGVDHLLFVLGLLWLARGRALIGTITAFTLAHSVTLAAVTYGWVGIPEAYVNALIALSIAFIGVEALNARAGRRTFTTGHPWAVAFLFGLLHGFGFAEALVSLGLPEQARPAALLSFNIGVELGQIAFVLAVLGLLAAWRAMGVRFPPRMQVLPAYAIGTLGAFWFIQRLDGIFLGA